jgi:hypothetical protein
MTCYRDSLPLVLQKAYDSIVEYQSVEAILKRVLFDHSWAHDLRLEESEKSAEKVLDIRNEFWAGDIKRGVGSSLYRVCLLHKNHRGNLLKCVTFFNDDLGLVVEEIKRVIQVKEPNKERLKINL